MSNYTKKPPAIAVVGPTASGKTALSVALAERFAGEVISADSRQVYRGMDIGTAKITPAEMRGIPHHLIDVCEPTTVFSAADFVHQASQALQAITERTHLPIVAGGTFFYLDLLMGKVTAPAVPANPVLRAELEQLSSVELHTRLTLLDKARASTIDANNPRRLVRAIEIATALGVVPPPQTTNSPYRWLTLGIDIPLDVLEGRIKERVLNRIDNGMIEEVEQLHNHGVSYERLDAFGLEYRYIGHYLQGSIDRQTMITELITKSRQFAKRQKTWLKRDASIQWLTFPTDLDHAATTVSGFLEEN